MMLVRLALRNVLRQRRRTALAVAVIMTGTVALLFTAGFVRFSFEGLREGIITGGLGHLEIRPARSAGDAAPEPGEPDWSFAEWRPVRQELESLPHVVAAEATLQFTGLLSMGDQSVAFLGVAVEPERERRMGFRTRLLEGRDLADDAPSAGEDEVLLGRGLARAAGVGVGDFVTLVAMSSDGMLNALDVTVAGVLTTGVQELDTRFLKVHLETGGRLLQTESISSLIVGLESTDQLEEVSRQLEPLLQGHEPVLARRGWKERAHFYSQVESLYRSIFVFLGLIVFSLACLSTSSTLLISVLERVREFGTLRAMGTGRAQVALLVLCEALWLGLIGTTLGTLVGVALAELLSRLHIQMPPPPGGTGGIDLQLLLVPGDALRVAALMLVVAAVAAFVPAVNASRRRIVEALAHV